MKKLWLIGVLCSQVATAQEPVTPDRPVPSADAAEPDAATASDEPSNAPDPTETTPARSPREPGQAPRGGDARPLPEAARPHLTVEVEPREGVMTGDVVHLRIRADARKSDDLAVPREQDFAPWDVLDRQARVEENADRAVHVFQVDLLALEPGEHTIGPVRIRVVTAEGVVGEVETDPIPLRVGSVLGNEPDAQPKPPTEPVQVWQDDYSLLWVLGALGLILLTALLTLLLARWWRRRVRQAAPPPPPRPAWEIALERLEALRRDREAAVAEGRVVEWVDGVSDAVREYLGHRFGFEGLESTTDEVLRELEGKKLIGVDRSEVAALLHDCDLVKFAKATFDGDQCDTLLAAAFRIVRASAPQPSTPQPLQPQPPHSPGSRGAPPVSSSAPSLADPPAPRVPAPSHPDARWMPHPSPAALPATRETPSEKLLGAIGTESETRSAQMPPTRPPPAGADTIPETVLGIPGASPDASADPEDTR